jgi:hypothetical protein
MRTTGILGSLGAALVLSVPLSANAQCSALTNMQHIASGNNGVVLSETLDDNSAFTITVSSGVYTIYVGNDCIYSGSGLTEDASGYGYINAQSSYSVVIEYSCSGAPSGGVIIDIMRDSIPEAHEYTVDSAADASDRFPPDVCPCAGIGGTRMRGCTVFACNNNLDCKRTNIWNPSSATAWCYWNESP